MYRWNLRSDSFAQVSELSRLSETMMLYGGYTPQEINADLDQKAKILNWMIKNKVFGIDEAGFIVANYYKNPSKIIQLANDDVQYTPDLLK